MTSTNRNLQADASPEQLTRARNTLRAALVLFGALATTLVLQIFLYANYGGWQLVVVISVELALALLIAAGAWLSRRGRHDLAAGLVIASMLVVSLVDAALLAGLGVVLGLAMLLATVAIATQTLPQQWVNRALLASVVAGLAAAALDVLAPPFQQVVPELQAVSPIIIVVTLALYGVLVWRQFQNYSLSTKLLIAFLGLSVAAVGVTTLVTDRVLRGALTEKVGANLATLAGSKALEIGQVLERESSLLKAFALDNVIRAAAEEASRTQDLSQAEIDRREADWQAARAAGNDADPLVAIVINNEVAGQLRRLSAEYPQHVELILTDRQGVNIAATNRTSDYYQADEAWWQAANDRGIYIGQPAFDESSQTFGLIMAIAVQAGDKADTVGVLRATISLDALVGTLAAGRFGQTGASDIYLPNGEELELKAEENGGYALHLEAAALDINVLIESTEAYLEVLHDGIPVLAVQTPVSPSEQDTREEAQAISGLDWRVVVHQDLTEALRTVDDVARATLLFALGMLGVAGISSTLIARVLSRPVTRLTGVAQQVSRGDLAARAPVESRDEIGALAETFNSMTEQLRGLVGSLESQVEARTAQLRASADVGRAAVSILDVDRLLREVVNLITDRFGFYYTAVFTLDEAGKFAVLREATGEAGRVLKERGHQLEVGGKSMVGSAVALRKPRIALDVGVEALRFANPLLPNTRSEIALPLIVGERVLGALDAQSTQAAAFDEANASLLQAMADQIAVALNNAELFRRADAQAQTQAGLLLAALELTGQLDRGVLFDVILRRARGLLNAVGADLWLPAGVEGFDRVASTSGESERLADPRAAPGRELVAAVATNQRALRLDDYAAWPLRAVPSEEAPFHAALAVPMMWQGQVSGVLVVTQAQPGPTFNADDERIALLFAAQAAGALAGASLLEEQRRTLEELDEANRRLTGEAWAQHFSQTAEGGHAAAIARRGQASGEAWLPEVELAVAAKKPVAWSRPEDQAISSPFKAALAAPIVLRGEVIGALQVGEANRPRAWSADDLSFVQAVAEQVAQAVENARLLDQTQRAAQREKVIAAAADRIHRPIELDAILRAAVDEVRRITGSSEVSIQLGVADATGGNGSADDPRRNGSEPQGAD